MPLSCLGGNALWSNVRLDICRTAAAVTTERARASVVGEGVRVAHHSAERLGQLELVDLVLHVGHAVAGDGIEDLLRLLSHSLLNCSGVDRAVVIDGVDTALSGAAAICQLGLHLVKAILDSRTELAGLFKRLIAETADRVVVLTRDRGLLVTESPDCILEAVEVHGVAQACFSNWLTCGATVAEAKAVAAPTEDHGEEDDHTLRGIAAETVLTGSGRDVRK